MPRSTTSAATDRRRLAALLVAELICGLLLIGRQEPPHTGPMLAAPTSHTVPVAPATSQSLRNGRTARLIGLSEATAPLLARIGAQLDDAACAGSEVLHFQQAIALIDDHALDPLAAIVAVEVGVAVLRRELRAGIEDAARRSVALEGRADDRRAVRRRWTPS